MDKIHPSGLFIGPLPNLLFSIPSKKKKKRGFEVVGKYFLDSLTPANSGIVNIVILYSLNSGSWLRRVILYQRT